MTTFQWLSLAVLILGMGWKILARVNSLDKPPAGVPSRNDFPWKRRNGDN